ncbi:unnamed protein product [Strongylus vulgaris]|uniref:Protein Wnt n=1 Tax=Strongylus vulgaris TaxID=40348 RepID=A0A3P7JQG1_STRVU|nr:unnamed protein product [Strongylus vulgaris]
MHEHTLASSWPCWQPSGPVTNRPLLQKFEGSYEEADQVAKGHYIDQKLYFSYYLLCLPYLSLGNFCRFCRKNPDMMDSVRWNCTLIDPVTLELISDVIMREGTRESAFVHAVSAAGVAYRVTRDCARGLNERCGCDQSMLSLDPQVRSYDYQGCSDNVQYGIAISREFVDAAERGKNASNRAILNLHNNRAGRQVGYTFFCKACDWDLQLS